MAYIAVDKDGSEFIFSKKPKRDIDNNNKHIWWIYDGYDNSYKIIRCHMNKVPKGTSLKLTGKQMTWSDEPIKLI